ncbi:MAG TPA: MurR/RpiR family transcriptional regulator [Azospirillum sp.]|nr:MurR/RpiR family transcriptional regulator [Azospirillum sp.]
MDDAVPSIEQRILELYEELTASEKKLAKVVLECQGNLASYSATELSDRAGVSKATAVRFFRRLGYESYSAVRVQVRDATDSGSPLAEILGAGSPTAVRGTLGAHLAQDLQNLTRTIEGLRSDVVEAAVETLADADRVWVVGFRNSHALALYARAVLVQLKPDIRLIPAGGLSAAEELAGIGPRDAVLAIGFRRRLQALLDVLEVAREAGARIVLLTDPTAAKSARLADVVLRCYTRGVSLFDSYVAPMSVLNHLFSSIAGRLGEVAVERLDHIERTHERLATFARRNGQG